MLRNIRRIWLSFALILGVIYVVSTSPVAHALFTWTPESGWRMDTFKVEKTAKAQYDYGLATLKRKAYPEAWNAFDNLIRYFPESNYVRLAYFYRGEALFLAERRWSAFKSFQKLVETYPDYRNMDTVFERQFTIANQFQAGKKREIPMTRLKWLPAKSDAMIIYKRIIENDPYGKYGARAQFEIGRVYEDLKRWNDAIDAYDLVLDNYGDTDFAVKSKYRKSICHQKLTKGFEYNPRPLADAVENLTLYEHRIKDGKEKQEIRQNIDEIREKQARKEFEIASYYRKKKKYPAAKIYFDKIVREYADTTYAEKAKAAIAELPAKK